MLDQQNEVTVDDTVAAQVEGGEVVTEEAPEPEGEVVISIEGEEPEVDEDAEVEAELGDKGKRALKAAREAAKEAAKEAREAKARLAEIEAASKPKEPELKRPTLEDCGFNEDAFAEKLTAYMQAQAKANAAKAEEEAARKATEEAYQAKLSRYHSERTKVGVDDDVQAVVVAKLSPQQQAALMDASLDPAKVVAALAKTPKVLDELSGIKEIHKFTYRLAQIEGKITMTAKTPPPPESKIKAGVAAGAVIGQAQIEKLRLKAEQTGNYTEYFAAKWAASAKA